MDRESELEIIRRAYAKQILSAANIVDAHDLENAFASVRREDYLGEGPWSRFQRGRYVQTTDSDPVYLYTDDVFAIDKDKRLNNGQPSLHAWLISNAAPMVGERLVHIGCGVGYFTAIMAQLVGLSGGVQAVEYEENLAGIASENLAKYENTEILQGDGTTMAFENIDVLYVNAGVTRPPDKWLDALADGGRMILPLTTNASFDAPRDIDKPTMGGAVFLVTRRGSDYLAQCISGIVLFPCVGARNPADEAALRVAFEKDTISQVQKLYRHGDIDRDQCWLRAPDWCLAYN